MSQKCQHGLKDWACTPCCLRDLWDRLDDLNRAVTAARTSSGGSEFVTGGARSYEPINLSARALQEDIAKAGGLRKVQQTIGRGTQPDLERTVRQWRSRARLILGEAVAPYRLHWTHVPYLVVRRNRFDYDHHDPAAVCPKDTINGPCLGALWVHYDDQPWSPTFMSISRIECRHDDTHLWEGGLGFMKLGRENGGRSGTGAAA